MKLRSKKRLVAWLGLLAMWLAVVAPVISQLLAQAERAQLVTGTPARHGPTSMGMSVSMPMSMSMSMPAGMTMNMTMPADAPAPDRALDDSPGSTGRAQAIAENLGAAASHAGHGHDGMSDHGSACAYCGFLADHLPITSLSSLTFDSVFPLTRVLFLAAASAILARCYNAARPRAPPAFLR